MRRIPDWPALSHRVDWRSVRFSIERAPWSKGLPFHPSVICPTYPEAASRNSKGRPAGTEITLWGLKTFSPGRRRS